MATACCGHSQREQSGIQYCRNEHIIWGQTVAFTPSGTLRFRVQFRVRDEAGAHVVTSTLNGTSTDLTTTLVSTRSTTVCVVGCGVRIWSTVGIR